MRRSTSFATTIALSSILLAGCAQSDDNLSTTDGSTDTAAAQPSNVEAGDRQWDTGNYLTTPWELDDSYEDPGPKTEISRYGDHVFLPLEIDPRFAKGTFGRPSYHYNGLQWMSMAQFEVIRASEGYMGAFTVAGLDDAKGERVLHSVLRFTTPDEARLAAEAIANADRTDGSRILEEDSPMPGAPVEIPGHPELLATQMGDQLSVVTTHNQFLVYGSAEYVRPLERDDVPPPPEPDLSWQPGYIAAYFEKQLPEIDSIVAYTTSAGVGNSSDWQPIDPNDVLRYTLQWPEPPAEEDFHMPMSYGPRSGAARYRNTLMMWNIFNEAGVDTVANNYNDVFRARDEQSAAAMVQSLRQSKLDDEFREYQDPQGVPGTTCLQRDEIDGVTYTCYIQFGRFVATGGSSDKFQDVGDDIAPYELSQLMAAQYVLFEQMDPRDR